MGRLLYGTSSWSEKSWSGCFYPTGLPAGDQLRHYATCFPAVEADVTYYRVPDRRLVRGWAAKTPADFRLCAKFPRSIVHGGEGPKPDPTRVLVPAAVERDLERFLDAMGELGERCGPLVLQFPYFNRSHFARVEDFRERLAPFLDALPRTFRYGVEVRNAKWIDAPLLELLRERNVALVLVDLAYMPHPAGLARQHDLVSADFVYARLIGDRKETEELCGGRFDRIVLDLGERLDRWADLLRDSLGRVPEVYAFANNHYAGFGPDTIRDLVRRIGGDAPQAPAQPLLFD